MIGWEELARKTSDIYLSLPLAQRGQTVVFADDYGIAGALEYYRQKSYALPQVISLSSSFSLWAPDKIMAKNIIYFSSSKIAPIPSHNRRNERAVINNRFSGIYRTEISLLNNVGPEFKIWYMAQWAERQRGYAIPIRTSVISYQSQLEETMGQLFSKR